MLMSLPLASLKGTSQVACVVVANVPRMKEEFVRAAAEQGPSSSAQEDVLFQSCIRLVSLLLVVAACGGDSTTTTSDTTTTTTAVTTTTTAVVDQNFPATVTAANGEVVIPARPEAIVSLSATATEMLFAIGAGDQVVAVAAERVVGWRP